ncbi:hypothetical protein Cfor_02221 [Coptotermes formosanus]|uniref:Uncharacterized protein n=1 Tax=Coptotermes formosanus TaxID=36987 RepID=A0A6L2Q3I6_COPFO|nr:hypothetical protein Cfor_02221 [Coptotermes formosanus]
MVLLNYIHVAASEVKACAIYISASVEVLLRRPFTVSPAAMSSLFKNLHYIGRGDYSQRYSQMFSRYIPGILPPMVVTDIEAHIAEIRELQNTLKAQCHAQGKTGDVQQGQKRKGDDKNYGPTFCIASQQ